MILNAAERAASLTDKLLAFSRKGKKVSISVDVHEVIMAALGMLKPSIDRRVVVEHDFKAGAPLVIGDPMGLQNVILNLGLNARDAMPEGGTLSISTSTEELDSSYCEASRFDLCPGQYLQISVRDTGASIEDLRTLLHDQGSR